MKTVTEGLFAQANARPTAPAYCSWTGSDWVATDWATFLSEVQCVARALHKLGIGPDTKIAILSRNRREWLIASQAVFLLGGAIVGIYETLPVEDIRNLIRHSEAKVVIVEDTSKAEAIGRIVPHVISLETSRGFVRSWQDLVQEGEALSQDVSAKPSLDHLATLIYTSGTTGVPKGAMLSHRNVASAIEIYRSMTDLDHRDVVISYLPLAHIAEQLTSLFAPPLIGCRVHLCPRADVFPECLVTTEPTLFFGVPRVWEKFRGVAMAAHAAGMKLDKDVLRNAAGLRRVRLAASGSAPIDPTVLTFFRELGIAIYEGYGMTETSSPITQNTVEHDRLGTVGRAVPGLSLRLAHDGEIEVSGPNVFMGYFKDPDATAQAFSADGWLRTGDLGTLDDDGFVTIVGRKKDILVTAGGKNIAPLKIEAALACHPLVAEAVVIGDRRPFLVAVLTLAPESASMSADAIKQALDEHLARVNLGLARPEQIKRYSVLRSPFSVDAGELTATLKLKRAHIVAKLEPLVERLYARAEPTESSFTGTLFGVSAPAE